MKAKKILAMLLCLTMLLSTLTACGGDSGSESGSGSSQSSQVEEGGESSEEAEGGEVSAEDFDPAELTMLIVSPMPNEEAYSLIAEEMSKITQEKFNVTMNLMNVTISDYANKMNLTLASGDPLDIFQGFAMYNQFVSMGYMLNLDPYTNLLQDAIDTVGETARQGYYNGSLYSLPIINLGGTGGSAYAFRKDIIDELGIDLADYPTFADLEEVLAMIKEAHPDMTPMMSGGSGATIVLQSDPFSGTTFDGLNNQFCNIDPSDPDAKVEVVVKRDYWKQVAELAWDWAQEGLLGYDELSVDYDNVKAGRAACMNQGNGPAALSEAENTVGMEMVLWEPQNEEKGWISTMNNWSWSLTEYTEHPEQAALVLNELYINPDLSNLLVWGVEDVHYQVVDEENGLVDFMPGENAGNAGYYNLIKDNVPNLYICYEGVFDTPNKYEGYQNWKTERMQVSPYIGFVPDENAYANEATACKNVLDQYSNALWSGQLDPSVAYDQMISELDAAGIETIREELQKQLDAWVAENENEND